MIGKESLGKEAQDKITGFKGTIIGTSQWLTGCDQVCLKPKVDKDGQIKDAHWFDQGSVKITGKGITKDEVKSKDLGGPRSDQPKA